MADDVTLPGYGEVVATDQVAGAGMTGVMEKPQKNKIKKI